MSGLADITIDIDAGQTYQQWTPPTSQALNIPIDLPVSAITNINGVSGPAIDFDGGATGLSYVPGGTAISLAGDLVVLHGGTGSTTAAGARTNLGAAASGVNADITSLIDLTGGLRLQGYLSAGHDPSLVELPTAFDTAIFKNTVSGNIFLAFNNAGVIVKVQLV